MKKLLVVVAAMVAVSFTSCANKQKAEEAVNNDSIEAVEAAAAEAAEEAALKADTTLVDTLVEKAAEVVEAVSTNADEVKTVEAPK